MKTNAATHPGPVIVVVSREQVEAQDTTSVLEVLQSCFSDPDRARALCENVDIAFDGYNQDSRELFEIPEVRDYVFKLDEQFPYWLYFLTKTGSGLQCVLLSFLPPYLTGAARQSIFPQKIEELLTRRWFPALNEICTFVGCSEAKIEELSNRAAEYCIAGPIR